MSILIGILLYALAIVFFCGLTRVNGADSQEPVTDSQPAQDAYEPASPHGAIHAPDWRL